MLHRDQVVTMAAGADPHHGHTKHLLDPMNVLPGIYGQILKVLHIGRASDPSRKR
jgi:hypothetical protein